MKYALIGIGALLLTGCATVHVVDPCETKPQYHTNLDATCPG